MCAGKAAALFLCTNNCTSLQNGITIQLVHVVWLLQAQLEEGHPGFPRESPVLSKIMSPAAMAELHWTRVPAVVIFGCFVADEDGEKCLIFCE